jgi:hypothetical protein
MHGHVQDNGRRQWRRPGWCVQKLADGTVVFVGVAELVVMDGREADHSQLGDEKEE